VVAFSCFTLLLLVRSYTAKPSFRAHFAHIGDRRHAYLVFDGSCCVAFIALFTGWGFAGSFITRCRLDYPWFALACVSLACLMAWAALLANNHTAWKLSQDFPDSPNSAANHEETRARQNYMASAALQSLSSCLIVVHPADRTRAFAENRVVDLLACHVFGQCLSPVVPILALLLGLYWLFGLRLHGGAVRAGLSMSAERQGLILKTKAGTGNTG